MRAGGLDVAAFTIPTAFFGVAGLKAFHDRWTPRTWFSPWERLKHQLSKMAGFEDRGAITVTADPALLREQKGLYGFHGIEGAHALESDVRRVREVAARGVVFIGPVHLTNNAFGGSSSGSDRGLTALGRSLVTEMNRAGVLLDLAHASGKTFDESLALTEIPPLVSHSGMRAVHDTWRNLGDDQIRAVASRGGVIGVMLAPPALRDASLEERFGTSSMSWPSAAKTPWPSARTSTAMLRHRSAPTVCPPSPSSCCAEVFPTSASAKFWAGTYFDCCNLADSRKNHRRGHADWFFPLRFLCAPCASAVIFIRMRLRSTVIRSRSWRGKFTTSKGRNQKFYFNLKGPNGEIILASQGYAGRDGCRKGIESVRTNSRVQARFEIKSSKRGQSYFVLKAKNGKVVGQSQMYKTDRSCAKGMQSVRKNAPSAKLAES